FPNSHDIYMHDTPEKSLFSRDARAYSHGCVRLEDPHAMAAAVLGATEGDVRAEIAKGKNGRRNVPQKIPVFIGYFTAWADTTGKVSYFEDIYQRDAQLSKALASVNDVRASGAEPVVLL